MDLPSGGSYASRRERKVFADDTVSLLCCQVREKNKHLIYTLKKARVLSEEESTWGEFWEVKISQ